MGKVKSVLAILLTAFLLIGGGLLPVAATRFQDKTTTNVVQYENIEALQLRLEEEALSMSYQEKMFLLMHGEGLEITDEKTKIKEERIMEATYGALMPYMDLFLGGSFDNDYIEYYPVMVYDASDPSRYVYYWHVILSLDMSFEDTVSLVLDDETGKALAVELIDPEMHIEEAYLPELQYTLAAAYFTDLEIEPVAEWPLAVEKYDDMGSSLAATEYACMDDMHGVEINVQIGVRPDGFFIYLA